MGTPDLDLASCASLRRSTNPTAAVNRSTPPISLGKLLRIISSFKLLNGVNLEREDQSINETTFSPAPAATRPSRLPTGYRSTAAPGCRPIASRTSRPAAAGHQD